VKMQRMPDGTLYAGTFHGVVGWNPETPFSRPPKPRLLLTRATVKHDGKTIRLPVDGQPLNLRWNDRELDVSAQALSYLDPSRNHYRFRMAGLDSGWVDTGTRNQRDFTGLAHGSYVLRIEAAGPDSDWASLPPLRIHVQRPPWSTPLAWIAYVLVALAILWGVLRQFRRRIEQRHLFQLAERERAMAEQASAAKSNFLATLGHEIRTPMTGVLGMAELLLRSPLAERQRGYAETIRRSGTMLLRLVNEALDMARIEAGRLELDLAALDPRVLLDDIVQLESGVAQAKGLQLSHEIDDAVPLRLKGDAVRIKQVLLNLVNNALKFTPSGGIELHMGWVDRGLDLRVRDTGPGIPDASRARLFRSL
jgi:signal transduction histidine kinase